MLAQFASLLIAASIATPTTVQRQAYMHSLLSFAFNGAERQFQGVGKPPSIAREIFDYCQIPPRAKYEEFLAGRPMFECEYSWLGIFKSTADFTKAVHDALPSGFTKVSCLKKYYSNAPLECLRNAAGVEVHLLRGDWNIFSFWVLAPPLSASAGAALRAQTANMLRGLLADMAAVAAHSLGDAEGLQFLTRHANELKECRVERAPTGRPVLSCALAMTPPIFRTDLIAAVEAALPSGFRRSACVESKEEYQTPPAVCSRGGEAVEIRYGAGLRIEGDDTAYPPSQTDLMKQFLAVVLPAAERDFRGFDAKAELPYFGHCDVVPAPSSNIPTYLSCDPSHRDAGFDLYAVFRGALPPGYAASTCKIYNFPFINPEDAKGGCFGASGKPEIDVFNYEGWSVHIGLPRS